MKAGLKSQFIGSNFEDWVNTQHEKAKLLGILAHVEKTQAKTMMKGSRLIYTENGVADYVGTLEGGRSLATEAKSTSKDRFPKSEVTFEQQRHLEAVARAGGLALLVVEFQGVGKFAIPWLDVPWTVARTAEALAVEDAARWKIVNLDGTCYLSPWHAGGPRSSAHLDRRRKFARE